MNQRQILVPPVTRNQSDKKQIRMNVHGCLVKLNISAENSNKTRMEMVKRMILGGLSKV